MASVVSVGSSLLELGAGAGRLTRPLVDAGYRVVAVDESDEMLARIDVAETVRSRIEDLDLRRRFDAVLLASYLANVTDDDVRRGIFSACAVHLAPGGVLLIQRHPPAWFDAVAASGTGSRQSVSRPYDMSWPAPNILSATIRYTLGPDTWTQSFLTKRLSDADLSAELDAAGLILEAFLDRQRSWALVRSSGSGRVAN